ncbi:MAG: tetratricopeptide repeat protein [Chitinophagaceae bacterium]
MKYLLLLSILFFSSIEVSCQNLLDLNKKFVELFQQGKYEEAIPYAEKAFATAKKELPEDHPDYATNLENLGWVYLTAGYYSKAEPAYKELVKLKARLLGKEHSDYATMLNNLAILYYYMGEYVKAEPYYLEALSVRKKVLGDEHPDYATSLDNLGALYAAVEEFEKAEQLYQQALAIRKRILPETDPDYITNLNNLGSLYLSMGEYARAEPLYLQAVSIRKKTVGEEHPEYATSLNNLGALYLAIGQYEKATTLFTQSMKIRKKVLGENHPSYLVSTNNLSQVYAATGRYRDAIILCEQTIAIRKKVLGEEHPDYATSLNNLSVLYAEIGEYAKGEPYCAQAAAIRKKIMGASHSDYAASLNNLALIYKGMGQYKKAEPLFIQANGIYKISEGEQSSKYTISLDNLAILYMTTGEYAKAAPLSMLSSTKSLQHITSTFAVLSEKEKGNYLSSKGSVTEISNNILFHYPQAPASLRVNNFNLQLALKSLSLADTRNMITAVRNSKDTVIKKIFNNWMAGKNYLAKQYSLPVKKRDPDLSRIETKTEEFEKELNRRSVEFRKQQSAINISVADVQKNMQDDEAAIEFVSFTLYNKQWTDSVIYAASVLRKNDPAPVFVPLFEERQLQRLYDSAGKSATTAAKTFYRGLIVKENASKITGENLYKLIWQPLEPYLSGIKKISYSPAGKLYGIAFHALQVDSTTLLMDKYQLQQYTSTRQIASGAAETSATKPGNIVLFGDAAFNMDSVQMVKQRINKPTGRVAPRPPSRGGATDSWPALPGTAEEVKKIGQLFTQQKITAGIYTQGNASEGRLKMIAGNNAVSILHIATHGFFLPPPDDLHKKEMFDQQNSYAVADDPLFRSGLILAGGNYAWRGGTSIEGVEDGIVTAYEISQMNLSNTELVVLSACETALGDVKGNEGVFGLQRGFKMAGVKKMIVSLWQVPDKETAELMTTFYDYWIKGKSINQAFYQAQAAMRKKYGPFYWAAFVLVE